MHTYQSECDPSCSRYKNQHNTTGHISLNSLHNCVTLAVDYATQTIYTAIFLLLSSFHLYIQMPETGDEDTKDTPFFKYHHLKAIQDVSFR